MIATMKHLATMVAMFGILGVVALYLYTRPALRRLPREKAQSHHGITTIDDAVAQLRATGKSG